MNLIPGKYVSIKFREKFGEFLSFNFLNCNLNWVEISVWSHTNFNGVIATLFCTYPDSTASITCARFCSDIFLIELHQTKFSMEFEWKLVCEISPRTMTCGWNQWGFVSISGVACDLLPSKPGTMEIGCLVAGRHCQCKIHVLQRNMFWGRFQWKMTMLSIASGI